MIRKKFAFYLSLITYHYPMPAPVQQKITIEDIKDVKGIGDITFEKMKEEIAVSN